MISLMRRFSSRSIRLFIDIPAFLVFLKRFSPVLESLGIRISGIRHSFGDSGFGIVSSFVIRISPEDALR